MSNALLRIAGLVLAATLSFAVLAQAPRPAPFIDLNPPQPTESGGKIEVIEFFWFGCPHCYALEPFLEPWIKKLPKDVVFRRVPAIFNDQWGIAGRVFYTLEAIGEEERLHRALFDAIHKDNLRITEESAMAGWLAKQKVDVEKYKAAYRSFAVETKLRRALQMTQAYRFDGVPALAVQGRYVVTASMINDRQDLLDATDQLIRTAQKPAAGAPAAAKPPAPAKPAASAAKSATSAK